MRRKSKIHSSQTHSDEGAQHEHFLTSMLVAARARAAALAPAKQAHLCESSGMPMGPVCERAHGRRHAAASTLRSRQTLSVQQLPFPLPPLPSIALPETYIREPTERARRRKRATSSVKTINSLSQTFSPVGVARDLRDISVPDEHLTSPSHWTSGPSDESGVPDS